MNLNSLTLSSDSYMFDDHNINWKADSEHNKHFLERALASVNRKLENGEFICKEDAFKYLKEEVGF